MGKLCDGMKQASDDVWRWFFPKKINVPECVRKLLEFIYPTVNWDRVSFYDGWPHVLGFSSNAAITLPDTYSPHLIRIYFKPGRWNPRDCGGLGLIVHEGFHVLQIQDMLGGIGLGLARPFTLLYLACWADNGFSYDGHPTEDDAYVVGGRSTSLYESCCDSSRLPCDFSTDPTSLNTAGLAAFEANCQNVVQRSSGLNFWKSLADCTPGLMRLHEAAQWLFRKTCRSDVGGTVDVPVPTGPGPGPTDPDAPAPPRGEPPSDGGSGSSIPTKWIACFFGLIGAGILYIIFGLYYAIWMIVWAAVTIVLWVLKVIAEIIGLIVTGIMWVVTAIVCAVEWIWEKLIELWRWFKGVLRKVCNWADRLEKRCTEWEEERKKQCAETKDKGYNKCTETRDEGYNECCDWWPCSWGCSAWVWVSNIVCVAWTWVSNIVCVAWTWIVSKTCKAFTWVVKKATCW